jgi:predicted kinase
MRETRKGLLIVLGGLPGSGKTSIAKEISIRLNGVYLRIDTIEQALLHENCLKVGHEGYVIAYALAEDNLRAGNVVIADSVNPIPITREAWHSVGEKAAANILEIEVVCSDKNEHRRRVEARKADIAGHKMPTWSEVINREYHEWQTKHLTIDTSKQSVDNAVEIVLEYIAKMQSG